MFYAKWLGEVDEAFDLLLCVKLLCSAFRLLHLQSHHQSL